MSAYVIVDIEVTDDPGMAEYRKLVPATVEKYGGRFAVRGGKFEVREGQLEAHAHRAARVPQHGRRPPLVRLAGIRAAAGHAPQGVQGQPGDRGGRVVAGRYFFSNVRLISVSAQAIASLGLAALVTTLATMLGMM